MRNSLSDQEKRVKWIRSWPTQIILAANMIRWTKGSEYAIMAGRGDVQVDEHHPEFNNLENF